MSQKSHTSSPSLAPVTPDASDAADATGEPSLDAVLIERAQAGDAAAWSRLYQRNFDRVYRRVTYLTRDAQLAEDLAQEAFAQALSSLPSFGGRSTFSTWLHGIATNVVRRHWRKTERGRRARVRLEQTLNLTPDACGVSRDDPESAHLTRQRARVLHALLDELPAHLREAFVLVDLERTPTAECAAQLGISKSNVAVRAHRARAKIRQRLVELGWLEENS